MTRCLISLGSNVGARHAILADSLALLRADARWTWRTASAAYVTQPVGGPPGQCEFLNAAAVLETTLAPGELLAALQNIESRMGRTRSTRWGPRTLDLDLLLYDDLQIRQHDLMVPHPRMAVRRFVLEPAVEVAADWVHPEFGWTLQRLLDHLLLAAPLFVVAAADRGLARHVAAQAAQRCGGTLQPLDEQADPPALAAAWSGAAHVAAGSEAAVLVDSWWCDVPVCPKLLIVLQRSAVDEPFAEALLEQWRRRDCGPYLRVNAADAEWAVEETAAAIVGMR